MGTHHCESPKNSQTSNVCSLHNPVLGVAIYDLLLFMKNSRSYCQKKYVTARCQSCGRANDYEA